MAEPVGLVVSRVEQRLGNFVLQMIGYEQRIAELEAENAALKQALGRQDAPDDDGA